MSHGRPCEAPVLTQQAPPSSPGPLFWLACLTTFVGKVSFFLLGAALPLFVAQIGGGPAEVGLVIGAFTVTALVLRLPIGRMMDRHGPAWPMLGGLTLIALATFLMSFADHWIAVVPLRVLQAVGWAGYGTGTVTLAALLAPKEKRAETLAYWGMVNNLAMLVAPPLGVWVAQTWGFHWLFVVTAAGCLLSLATVTPFKRLKGDGLGDHWLAAKALLPSLLALGYTTTYGAVLAFLPLFANRFLNPGLFFSVMAGTIVLIRPWAGRWSDQFGRRRVLVPALAVAGLGLLILSQATVGWQVLAAACVYGMGFSSLQPTVMALIVDRVAASERGVAMATYAGAIDIGVGLGAMLGGFLALQVRYEGVFLLAGVWLMGLALLVNCRYGQGQNPIRLPGMRG